jgi:hypothetical protein
MNNNMKEYKDNIIGIYKITCLNTNKIYIGQSIDINKRFKTYQNLACKGQVKLYNSFKKYGIENHKFEIIEECLLEDMDEKELFYKKYYINEIGWKNVLFLMLKDGKGGNKNISTKNKMSISSTKYSQKIQAYKLSGEYVGEFESASSIKMILFPDSKINTGDIFKVCRRKKQKSCNGYIFQFSDDNKINEILNNNINNKVLKQKKILQFDLNGKFIKEYQNSYQAEKELNPINNKIRSGDIRACCNGKQRHCGNFIFKYGDDSINNKYNLLPEYQININKENFEKTKRELEIEKIIKSKTLEKEIYNFLRENYNNKIILNFKNEINFFIPELNLGFNILNLKENTNLPKNYNKNLFIKYSALNIKLIQIFSDEIINKKDIVYSRILNELKITKNKIYARKCEIKEIVNPEIKNNFLNNNHIQGSDRSKIKIGLYYNNELVSLMTFNHPRIAIGIKEKNTNENSWELLRFCNKINYNVVGGASKLLSYFIKTYKPNNIYSFADNRWSSQNTNLYKSLGFEFKSSSQQGYFYTKDFTNRMHRFNFNKGQLKKMGMDTENNTEFKIMDELGYYKIWDCGVSRYELYV